VRPKRIAEVLKEIDADVVALQEVVGMDEATREHNQVRAIAEELGLDFRIGENRRLRGAAYGNTVLSRLPIVSDHNHDVTWRMNEPRGCLEVTIKLPGDASRTVQVFNVHLGTGFSMLRFVEPTRAHLQSATAVFACSIVPFHSKTRTPASSKGRYPRRLRSRCRRSVQGLFDSHGKSLDVTAFPAMVEVLAQGKTLVTGAPRKATTDRLAWIVKARVHNKLKNQ